VTFGLLVVLFAIAKQIQHIQSIRGFLLIAGLLGILGLFFVIDFAILIMFPSVKVIKSGMQVQFFWFWWISVPWGNVLDLYHWPRGLGRIVIVEVEGLTPFHLFYGLLYAHKAKPAFLIATSITEYDDLIGTMTPLQELGFCPLGGEAGKMRTR
jgi:hypothetical protein